MLGPAEANGNGSQGLGTPIDLHCMPLNAAPRLLAGHSVFLSQVHAQVYAQALPASRDLYLMCHFLASFGPEDEPACSFGPWLF